MLKLHTNAQLQNNMTNQMLKIVSFEELIREPWRIENCLLDVNTSTSEQIELSIHLPLSGYFSKKKIAQYHYDILLKTNKLLVFDLDDEDVISTGDVIRVNAYSSRVRVLYRRGSNSNLLFLTERCNSRCIMCSQPPREACDDYLLDECFELIDLIDRNELSLGISGGEPTLYGDKLFLLIDKCHSILPDTQLHILTNGRLLAESSFLANLRNIKHDNILWGVPIFSANAKDHDLIASVDGAFLQTINGLYNLALTNQKIELRIILLKPVIDKIEELSYFISRSLSFISYVSIMGIEPIGLAKKIKKKSG